MTAGHPDSTAEALSAFLVDHAELLLPLALHLGQGQTDFESTVRGSSMAPAIPAGARIRVRPGEGPSCRVGDVVFWLAVTSSIAWCTVRDRLPTGITC